MNDNTEMVINFFGTAFAKTELGIKTESFGRSNNHLNSSWGASTDRVSSLEQA